MGEVFRIKYQFDTDGDDCEPEKMLIQSTKMKALFGISNNKKFCKNPEDKVKWDIQLSFQGEERSKKIQRFRSTIEDIDTRNKKEFMDNADTWIPLPDEEDDDGNFLEVLHDMKSVRKSYRSALKRFKPKKDKPDEKFPDNFKISIPWDTKPRTDEDEEDPEFIGNPRKEIEFYDEHGKEISWKDVPRGCEVVAMFEINGLWCSTGFGTVSPSVKLVQLQVFKPKKLKGFQIKYEAEDDEEDSEDDEDGISIEEGSLDGEE